MRAPYRNKFDPAGTFVVRRKFAVEGVEFKPGQNFDKTLVSTRRLRQMFDQRTIVFDGETPGAILRDKRHRHGHAEAASEPAETQPDARSAVPIPDDWRALSWPRRRALATLVSDGKVSNGTEAETAILAELERRKG